MNKLSLVKNILERKQNYPIKQSFVFIDNDALKKNREDNKIKFPCLMEPYGLFISSEEIISKTVKVNSSGKIIPSHFFNNNKLVVPVSAKEQFCWSISKMKFIKNLY